MMIKNHKVDKITSLGGTVTYQTDLYGKSAKLFGINHVKISEVLQKRTVEIIEAIKKNGITFELRSAFSSLIDDSIKETSANGVILACTEFSEFYNLDADVPIVDSSLALAQHAVDFAKNNIKIELNTKKVKSFGT